MKITKLLTIVSALLLISSCTENKLIDETKSDLEKQNLQGKVYRVIENSYYTKEKFGEVIKTDQYERNQFYFNEQGYFTEKTERSDYSDSFSYSKETFQYDQQNNIIEKIFEVSNDMFGEYGGKSNYKFDEKSNKTEENHYDSEGKLITKSTYIYDSKGNKIEENIYNSEKELTRKSTYKYDSKGNNIEESEYYKGELDSKITYQYDEKENIIEKVWYDSDGKLSDKRTYKYDNKGNNIEENYYEGEELNIIYIYKYDDKGHEIECNGYNSDDILIYESTYKYNEKGNKLEEKAKSYYSDGKLRYDNFYKYDERGNLIKKLEINIDIEPQTVGVFVNTKGFMYVYHDTKILKVSYEYDKNNNITEEVNYIGYLLGRKIMNEGESKANYIYQFDDKENWVIKKSIEQGKVLSITERGIEYY